MTERARPMIGLSKRCTRDQPLKGRKDLAKCQVTGRAEEDERIGFRHGRLVLSRACAASRSTHQIAPPAGRNSGGRIAFRIGAVRA